MSDGQSHVAPPGQPAFEGDRLADAMAAQIVRRGTRAIRGAAVDSRRVARGNAFFALPGERTDGQRFLSDAVAAGAAALIVRDDLGAATLDGFSAGGVWVLRVRDAGVALRAAASAWRDRYDPLVVGVTGSLAKTSTKEQVAETLSVRWRVLRNEGNENNEVGLPLTLLRMSPADEVAVLEMGMYVTGDIALLAALARPSIGVVTAVRATHLSRAGSLDAIERGKRELVEALPSTGTAVLNVDDPRVARMRAHTPAQVIGYGFDAAADVRADDVTSLGDEGMTFSLRLPADRVTVRTPALGRHSVHNALAAAAVGLAAGMGTAEIAAGLSRGFHAPHRTHLVHVGEWRILDDSYNASPDSMIAALELLAELPGRRIAVLGEMLELGDGAPAAHVEVGSRAAEFADLLVAVGPAATGIAQGARDAGMDPSRIAEPPDREAAIAWLLSALQPGDTVLVKASRGAELDRVVDALVATAGPATRA